MGTLGRGACSPALAGLPLRFPIITLRLASKMKGHGPSGTTFINILASAGKLV